MKFEQLKLKCRDLYWEYTRDVSEATAALSWEALEFMLDYLEKNCTKEEIRVLDLGSGISTACFRYYAQQLKPAAFIVSVDTSLHWLMETRKFLCRHSLAQGCLLAWEMFVDKSYLHGSYDYILFDMAETSYDRKEYIVPVLTQFVDEDTVVFLDDMHKRHLRGAVERRIKENFKSCTLQSFVEETKDEFGRYMYVAKDFVR